MRDRLRALFGRDDDDQDRRVADPDAETPASAAAAAAARIDVRGSGGAADDATAAAGLDDLRAFVRAAGADLPTVVSSRVRHVEDLLRDAAGTVIARGASTEQRYLFQAVVDDYLPTPVRTYRSLPPVGPHPGQHRHGDPRRPTRRRRGDGGGHARSDQERRDRRTLLARPVPPGPPR
ncbi:hypothetical protein [Curtobacterium sp. MCJR17_043]|uniref:hypothetical protein n=1 Tax=Curtobacterium sp. MCJR17_043 TaxID=2175660 RepID=UPI0024DF3EBE|nr:hypothetical protein [Curtobacterium sp. MCJR17_043]WIB35026.1 hypothetical protein DEJ15_11165 [Curtobacterium sp. MCJR17_043]